MAKTMNDRTPAQKPLRSFASEFVTDSIPDLPKVVVPFTAYYSDEVSSLGVVPVLVGIPSVSYLSPNSSDVERVFDSFAHEAANRNIVIIKLDVSEIALQQVASPKKGDWPEALSEALCDIVRQLKLSPHSIDFPCLQLHNPYVIGLCYGEGRAAARVLLQPRLDFDALIICDLFGEEQVNETVDSGVLDVASHCFVSPRPVLVVTHAVGGKEYVTSVPCESAVSDKIEVITSSPEDIDKLGSLVEHWVGLHKCDYELRVVMGLV